MAAILLLQNRGSSASSVNKIEIIFISMILMKPRAVCNSMYLIRTCIAVNNKCVSDEKRSVMAPSSVVAPFDSAVLELVCLLSFRQVEQLVLTLFVGAVPL